LWGDAVGGSPAPQFNFTFALNGELAAVVLGPIVEVAWTSACVRSTSRLAAQTVDVFGKPAAAQIVVNIKSS